MPGTAAADPSAALRALTWVWIAAAVGVTLLGAVVLMTSDATSTVPPALPVALTVAVAVGSIAAVAAVDRSLVASQVTDDEAAFVELRTRSFLQLAIVEAPVLLGVALGYTLGPPWVAVVGAVGALVGLAVARPTRGRIARLDATWQDAGRDVSILRGLDGDPPAG